MPYRKTSNNTSAPINIFPKGVFAFSQCAGYEDQEYISLLCNEQPQYSRKEVEMSFGEFGGVHGFLQLARDEKARNEDYISRPNTIVFGVGPSAQEAIRIANFPQWDFNMRVWGFEKLGPLDSFAFDFINDGGQHIKAPPGLMIVMLTVHPGLPVYSYQTATALSFEGALRETLANASEEDMGSETYIVPQGVMLEVRYNQTSVQVEMPRHSVLQTFHSVPLVPA